MIKVYTQRAGFAAVTFLRSGVFVLIALACSTPGSALAGEVPSTFEEQGCGYQSPEQSQAAIAAAVAAGEIADPVHRPLPRVAPRTILPGATLRGGGVPTVTQADIFPWEDTAQLLLTNFSDGALFDLMASASNDLLTAHGDNFDFVAFFLNFDADHQLGSAFYLGIFSDVTGLGDTAFDFRASLGLSSTEIEGWVMMWKESDWTPGLTHGTQLVLAQEFEHRYGMFLDPLNDGRVLQGDNGSCGRSAHWSFRADGQGSGMEMPEWVGSPTATRTFGASPGIAACAARFGGVVFFTMVNCV